MAKAGYFMGGARGKVGDFVFRKGEKGTVQAVKVTPANPKTLAQRKQRMSFAMANSAAAALRFIVNHSFENISGEKANIREFVRLNSKLLRAEIDSVVAGTGVFEGTAQIKGARGCQPANYIISRGSVTFPTLNRVVDNDIAECQYGCSSVQNANATIDTQEKYEKALNAYGFAPGDQLSVIVIAETGTEIANYNGESNYLCKVVAGRVTFVEEIPEGFNAALADSTGVINASLIAEKEGAPIRMTAYEMDEDDICSVELDFQAVSGANSHVGAAGIVRSVKNLNGKYEYSPCQLVYKANAIDTMEVLNSYADSNSASDSDYFLDQAE